eukprot:SAG11_NODE_7_length_31267_cov_19.541966_12_plen_87_part_00
MATKTPFTIYSLSQYHRTTLDDMRGHILGVGTRRTVGDKTYDTREKLKAYLYKYTRYSGTTKLRVGKYLYTVNHTCTADSVRTCTR